MNTENVWAIALEEAKNRSRRAWDAYQAAESALRRASDNSDTALSEYHKVKGQEYRLALQLAKISS